MKQEGTFLSQTIMDIKIWPLWLGLYIIYGIIESGFLYKKILVKSNFMKMKAITYTIEDFTFFLDNDISLFGRRVAFTFRIVYSLCTI